MGEVEKWVEDAAKANAGFQISCADALERQGSAFLNLALAGAGGSLAYAVNLFEKQTPLWQSIGMAAASAWLFIVAALVIFNVLWTRPIYGPANDPGNLKAAYGMALCEAQRFELQNRQFCIDANRARNDVVGRWLNICRGLAATTPLAFILAAFLAAYQ